MTRPAPPRGPRLLAGWVETRQVADLAAHVDRHGPLPVLGAALIGTVRAAGLLGRGGAWFPTGEKLSAVARNGGRRRPVVVANGAEGEPASDKDKALLTVAPHLVLDGMVLAAMAVGADEAILCVHRGSALTGSVGAAITERAGDPVAIRLVELPARYVASEESALVNYLNTGEARPTETPPRPYERGVRGRPTLVDNVETLANVALIGRYGADWFRMVGTATAPGTMLVTVGGAVVRPGVREIPLGTTVSAALGYQRQVVHSPAVMAGAPPQDRIDWNSGGPRGPGGEQPDSGGGSAGSADALQGSGGQVAGSAGGASGNGNRVAALGKGSRMAEAVGVMPGNGDHAVGSGSALTGDGNRVGPLGNGGRMTGAVGAALAGGSRAALDDGSQVSGLVGAAPGSGSTAAEQIGAMFGYGVTEPVSAVLVGGFGGNWLPLPEVAELPLTPGAAAGGALGVGMLLALPARACGLAETARILRYLAGESAMQCGPCMFGLASIVGDLEALTYGRPTVEQLRYRLGMVSGRGACAHPDGAVRLAASALTVFADDVWAHASGRPCAGARMAPVIRVPASGMGMGWR